MSTLTANVVAQIIATLGDPLTLSSPADPLNYTKKTTLTTGPGLNQGDKLYHSRQTILASATNTLDLAGGVLLDGLGDGLTLARIKAILAVATESNAGNIELTRPAVNGVPWLKAAGDAVFLVPGGMVLWTAPTAAGIIVTAGTGDLLDLVNTVASTVTCDVVILGAST